MQFFVFSQVAYWGESDQDFTCFFLLFQALHWEVEIDPPLARTPVDHWNPSTAEGGAVISGAAFNPTLLSQHQLPYKEQQVIKIYIIGGRESSGWSRSIVRCMCEFLNYIHVGALERIREDGIGGNGQNMQKNSRCKYRGGKLLHG